MSDTAAPFHYDIVGSFLRPEKLKTARAQFAEGAISHDGLEAVENEAIKELVAQQKAAGLHAVTDGEFRRSMWHLDFLTELLGCEEVGAEHWSVHFKGHQPKSKTVVITDKVDFGEHPFLKHFAFTNSVAGGTLVKQTIPSPTMLHLICCVREENYTPIACVQTLPPRTAKQSRRSTMQAAATCSSTTLPGASYATRTSALLMKHAASTWTNWSATTST